MVQLERMSQGAPPPIGQPVTLCVDPAHCVTCSDEAQVAVALGVDLERGVALVELATGSDEVDITLIDDVAPGVWLLVHGGVAIGRLGAAGERP
ncbi:MAG: HypC/HybG/HupF family hydrogenase formation chaperone [Chloroflexales bacterium]|nr:HypC/HybG/HupF family hydrogenase formation chaperone [Chloroflexales bacterium]